MKQKTKKIIISSIFLVFGVLISVKSASASEMQYSKEVGKISVYGVLQDSYSVEDNNGIIARCYTDSDLTLSSNTNVLWLCLRNNGINVIHPTYNNGVFVGYYGMNWLSSYDDIGIFYITPPAPVINTSGIFFPVDNVTGKTQAGDLVASAGTATSTTVESLTPVVVVVLGILLAFIAIKAVMGLIKDTKKDTKKATKDVKYTKKI